MVKHNANASSALSSQYCNKVKINGNALSVLLLNANTFQNKSNASSAIYIVSELVTDVINWFKFVYHIIANLTINSLTRQSVGWADYQKLHCRLKRVNGNSERASSQPQEF